MLHIYHFSPLCFFIIICLLPICISSFTITYPNDRTILNWNGGDINSFISWTYDSSDPSEVRFWFYRNLVDVGYELFSSSTPDQSGNFTLSGASPILPGEPRFTGTFQIIANSLNVTILAQSSTFSITDIACPSPSKGIIIGIGAIFPLTVCLILVSWRFLFTYHKRQQQQQQRQPQPQPQSLHPLGLHHILSFRKPELDGTSRSLQKDDPRSPAAGQASPFGPLLEDDESNRPAPMTGHAGVFDSFTEDEASYSPVPRESSLMPSLGYNKQMIQSERITPYFPEVRGSRDDLLFVQARESSSYMLCKSDESPRQSRATTQFESEELSPKYLVAESSEVSGTTDRQITWPSSELKKLRNRQREVATAIDANEVLLLLRAERETLLRKIRIAEERAMRSTLSATGENQ